jgi:ribosomal protein S18 acetylase RimI-like enzyme
MEMTMRAYILESINIVESIEHEGKGVEAAVFVAEDESGERLGFAAVEENQHFTGEMQAYIEELAVREEAEGRGVGSALVEACEQWARQHEFTLLVLDTSSANKRARALYGRLGFTEESVKLTKPLS